MISKLNTGNTFSGKVASFTTLILKGLGQIMLQENSITGFLFLIGIFYSSFIMGFAALLATICGTVTALLLKYNKSEIDHGIYGFSAALVGVALALFLKPVVLSWVIIIIGSSLATIIQHFFIQRKIPVFTLPFVLVTWIVILFSRSSFIDIMSEPSPIISSTSDYFSICFKGYGQVIFQDNLISGILFFVAVFISSPIAALYGLAGSILSAFIAFKLSLPVNEINLGLYGYNAVLCAIVFAGTQIKDGIWVLLSVLLSLFLSILMTAYHIIPLTFPFVLSSCIMLFIKKQI